MEVIDKSSRIKNDHADNRPLAYSYVRLSSDRQKKGDGLRRQLEETERYCEEKGLRLEPHLKDIGLSGWTGANVMKGVLGQFLDRVRKGKIPKNSHLVVESLDRLSRDKVMTAFDNFSSILRAGITIHTFADGKIYTEQSVNDSFSELIISLSVMVRANDESTTKANRQRKTWGEKRDKAKAGEKKLSARCPSWLELSPDRKSFKILKDRKALMVRMFTMAEQGFGCDSIARTFNREGIKPFAKENGLWHGGSVRAFLQSKAVLGHYQPNRTVRTIVKGDNGDEDIKVVRIPDGDVIADYYPQIIPDELWHRTWASIGSRSLGKAMNPQGRKGSKLTNLFSGFGTCVRCNSHMNVRDRGEKTRHKHKPFLICANSRNGVCSNNRQYTLQPLEDAVLEFVQELDLRETQPFEAQQLVQQIASKRIKADATQQRIDNLMEAVEAGSKSAQKRMVEVEGELETMEQEIAAIQRQLEEVMGAVPLADRQAAMKELRQRMTTATDTELFAIRTNLRQALREIITFMVFLVDGTVALYLKAEKVGYLYKDGQMIKRMEELKLSA